MAPAEDLISTLPQEVRKRIVKEACIAGIGTWDALRMVSKQFLKDCAVVGEYDFVRSNEYAFLQKPLAMVGVESARLGVEGSCEPMTCLQKALGEAGATLEDFQLISANQETLSKQRQGLVIHMLADCCSLRTLTLGPLEETLDIEAAALQSGVGFNLLRKLTIKFCSLHRFPFAALPGLLELYLNNVNLIEGPLSLVAHGLTSLDLSFVRGFAVNTEAPDLDHLVARGCTSILNFCDMPGLRFVKILDTESCSFQIFEDRLFEMSVDKVNLQFLSDTTANFKSIRLLTIDLNSLYLHTPYSHTYWVGINDLSKALKNVEELHVGGADHLQREDNKGDFGLEPGFDNLTKLTLELRWTETFDIALAEMFVHRANKLTHIVALIDRSKPALWLRLKKRRNGMVESWLECLKYV